MTKTIMSLIIGILINNLYYNDDNIMQLGVYLVVFYLFVFLFF